MQEQTELGEKRAISVANEYKISKLTLYGTEKRDRYKHKKEEVEGHLSKTNSHERLWKQLGNYGRIENVSQSEIATNIKESQWKEVAAVVGKAMSESAPGPTGISNKDSKKCTHILKRLIWHFTNIISFE